MSAHNSLIQRVSSCLVMLYKIRLISKIKGKLNDEAESCMRIYSSNDTHKKSNRLFATLFVPHTKLNH